VLLGRATAQAVSRWLPTAAARVRARVRSCEICGGQSAKVEGFSRVLRFPLPIFIPPIVPQSPSSSIIWGWYKRPTIAAVPSGPSLTPRIIIIIIISVVMTLIVFHDPLDHECDISWADKFHSWFYFLRPPCDQLENAFYCFPKELGCLGPALSRVFWFTDP
jgi:hypothetical protein